MDLLKICLVDLLETSLEIKVVLNRYIDGSFKKPALNHAGIPIQFSLQNAILLQYNFENMFFTRPKRRGAYIRLEPQIEIKQTNSNVHSKMYMNNGYKIKKYEQILELVFLIT